MAAGAVLAAALGACAQAGTGDPARLEASPIVVFNPEPTTGPFVVVAIDNHFHDIHPVDHTELAASRRFVVKNEGRNLHNFTVVGTNISVDIPAGHSLTWNHIGNHLPPGNYQVVCKYHAYLGMTGAFTVTGTTGGGGLTGSG
jgi:hypothetical protein